MIEPRFKLREDKIYNNYTYVFIYYTQGHIRVGSRIRSLPKASY
jgi:hypothetical protein